MDLSYPIGRFHWKGAPSDPERCAMIEQIATAPAGLRAAVAGLKPDQIETPYRPGGWTVRQVVHHVADSHMNAYVRFKLALTEQEPGIKPYDQDAWAKLADSGAPVETSLALIGALHERWVLVLRAMSSADFSRTLMHPEHGVLDLDRMLAMYAWHGAHHTAHVTALRDRMNW